MENEENNAAFKADRPTEFQKFPMHNKNQHWIGGIVVILVGLALLIRQMPQMAGMFPSWVFTWPMILIIIGILAIIKGRNFGGVVPILVGIFFLLQQENMLNDQIRPFVVPVIIILAGILLLFKRSRRCNQFMHKGYRYRKMSGRNRREARFTDTSGEDYLDINSVFGSAEKSMFSKNFKGGNITCAFGGGKINLTQADIEDKAILNIAVNFGGAEILVPANWQIQNELNALFGGIEDKRRASPQGVEPAKTLILRGNIFCGGVEIRN
jgi:predicted membrane protein